MLSRRDMKCWAYISLGVLCELYVCVLTLQSAVVALSAIINAMYETNMVIIVRRVYAANGAIRLGCLAPNIKKNYEVC